METTTRLRAYKFTLDATDNETSLLLQHAGSNRWAFNYGHALLLQQQEAYSARQQEHAEKLSGLDAAQLAELPATERRKIKKQASKLVRDENTALCTDLEVLDEHRKRVFHKGKPALEPGEEPGDDASPTARRLYQRRVELAALQQSDPGAYKEEKRAELESIRPQVLDLKRGLIVQGAYRPGYMDLATLWRDSRDLPKEEGGSPWYDQVSPYAFTSGFTSADTAWKNWMASAAGNRSGRRVGTPRFKKKGRSRDSFTLNHDVKNPTIRPDGYRRVRLPGIGSIRVHDSTKRLVRVLNRGHGVVKSVTVSRGAHRWYASLLVEETFTPPEPTRKQKANGRVGVNFGVHHHAALSTGEIVDNPRYLATAERKLRKAQQAVSRSHANGVKDSGKLTKKRTKLARQHHELAERRKGNLHQLTKRLTTQWAEVAIQDLDLVAMTRSARGTVDQPGTGVQQKRKLNKAVLDASFGEARRQLEYKGGTVKKIKRQETVVPGWYGSTIAVADRYQPVDQDCSTCGATKAKMPLSQRVYTCGTCGMVLDRDINAARNIAASAQHVAPDNGETENARGGSVSPSPGKAGTIETGRPSG